MEEDKVVFIKVKASTREDLKWYGIKGDTYEVIIRRLIGWWDEGEHEEK